LGPVIDLKLFFGQYAEFIFISWDAVIRDGLFDLFDHLWEFGGNEVVSGDTAIGGDVAEYSDVLAIYGAVVDAPVTVHDAFGPDISGVAETVSDGYFREEVFGGTGDFQLLEISLVYSSRTEGSTHLAADTLEIKALTASTRVW
jgi:hypothetical protein